MMHPDGTEEKRYQQSGCEATHYNRHSGLTYLLVFELGFYAHPYAP